MISSNFNMRLEKIYSEEDKRFYMAGLFSLLCKESIWSFFGTDKTFSTQRQYFQYTNICVLCVDTVKLRSTTRKQQNRQTIFYSGRILQHKLHVFGLLRRSHHVKMYGMLNSMGNLLKIVHAPLPRQHINFMKKCLTSHSLLCSSFLMYSTTEV